MDSTQKVNYNSILMDSAGLDDLACQVFMDFVHPLNFISRAAQIHRLLEADHFVHEQYAHGLKACHEQIEQAILTFTAQVKSLERYNGITQRFDDFYAGYNA